MIINFDQPNGDSVAVNPRRVTHVSRNHADPDACLICFGKDDYVSVVGSIAQVASRLSAAM